MKLDRLLFLSLATSIATVACSAASDSESDVDEGAVSMRQCKEPGADMARLVDTQVTFCMDFADRAAKKGDHFASVYGQCMTFASRYKSAAAEEAISCVKGNEAGKDTWDNLYGCGYSSLSLHCSDQERFASKCEELVSIGSTSQYGRTTHDGQSDRLSLVNECKGFLGGLEATAVADVEKCVREQKFGVYSCVEGLDATTKDRICVDPNVRERVLDLKGTCERLMTVSPTEEGILNRDTCLGIATRLRAAPANKFLESLAAHIEASSPAKPIGNYDLTQIAGRVMRDTCRNTAVDATCTEMVQGLKAAGVSNNGGRLTKECRQLLSAVDAKGGDQIRACANVQKKLARGSAAGLGAKQSLYWCMSDLRAYDSEL